MNKPGKEPPGEEAPGEEAPGGKAVDKRNLLDEEVFTYRVNQENKVFIAWRGQQVMVLKGKNAEKFLSRIGGLDSKAAQLVMAKVTGNFKRGERTVARGFLAGIRRRGLR